MTLKLNNCKNDLLEDYFQFPIMNVAPANSSYTQVPGSSINIDARYYTPWAKARFLISWGNITSSAHIAYVQVRDQDGNVLTTVSRNMPAVLTQDQSLGDNWYLDVTADANLFSIPKTVTSVSLYVYSSNAGAVNITTAFIQVKSIV